MKQWRRNEEVNVYNLRNNLETVEVAETWERQEIVFDNIAEYFS